MKYGIYVLLVDVPPLDLKLGDVLVREYTLHNGRSMVVATPTTPHRFVGNSRLMVEQEWVREITWEEYQRIRPHLTTRMWREVGYGFEAKHRGLDSYLGRKEITPPHQYCPAWREYFSAIGFAVQS